MNYLTTASTISQGYVDTSLARVVSLVNNPEVQAELKANGFNIKTQDITVDRLKNILSAVGLFSIMYYGKNNLAKVGVLGALGYVYFKNKREIESLVTEYTGYQFDDQIDPIGELDQNNMII